MYSKYIDLLYFIHTTTVALYTTTHHNSCSVHHHTPQQLLCTPQHTTTATPYTTTHHNSCYVHHHTPQQLLGTLRRTSTIITRDDSSDIKPHNFHDDFKHDKLWQDYKKKKLWTCFSYHNYDMTLPYAAHYPSWETLEIMLFVRPTRGHGGPYRDKTLPSVIWCFCVRTSSTSS